MAGMAEGAEQFALMIAWGGLLVAAIAAFVAFTRRSWIPVFISAIVLAGVTILFMPWNAFATVSAKELADGCRILGQRLAGAGKGMDRCRALGPRSGIDCQSSGAAARSITTRTGAGGGRCIWLWNTAMFAFAPPAEWAGDRA
jgi:hypothetical protein